ncbi:MAG: T9SS type A sorting domain-containing protein [Bacteroidetes bacterium]|nr:T9SS type A sorting domain-containing protein [Bacteroidota bacterium]
MKNFYLVIGLVLALVICTSENTSAQYILAGKHNPGNYYMDITPDTALTGPNNHPPVNLPPAVYSIDINGDNIKDFSLYAYGSWVNGTGDTKVCIKNSDTTKWQMAFGYSDTCYEQTPYYALFNMAKSLKLNDTIDGRLLWRNDPELLLTYTAWLVMNYSCDHNAFVNDSMGNYIGVRLLRPSDTIYGWIKITNVNYLSYTLQEFAFERSMTGMEDLNDSIKTFANPSNGRITIQTLLPGFDLTVYNILGIEVLPKMSVEGISYIDLSEKANGIYFFKFHRNNSTFVKKIIKH